MMINIQEYSLSYYYFVGETFTSCCCNAYEVDTLGQ